MRKFVLLAALTLPVAAAAQQWEYRVVHLPTTMDMTKPLSPKPRDGVLVEQPDGSHLNAEASTILNGLAAEGWEVTGVTGLGGGSHAVFLRRPQN